MQVITCLTIGKPLLACQARLARVLGLMGMAILISRPAALLKSFGRRRRTKVLEERTRGGQASVYGHLGFWLMQEAARRSPRHVQQAASFRYRCAVCRFCELQWSPTASVEASPTVSGTTAADRCSKVAAAQAWFGPCRLTEKPPRLSMARGEAPEVGSSGRRFRRRSSGRRNRGTVAAHCSVGPAHCRRRAVVRPPEARGHGQGWPYGPNWRASRSGGCDGTRVAAREAGSGG